MYKALVNFSGIISMKKNEIREIPNEKLANSLIKAKYIVKIESGKTKEENEVTKVVKPKKK